MKKLNLGLPKGTLENPVLALLEKTGMKIIINGRNFVADIYGNEIFSKAIFMRPNDLPLALKAGIVDAIITGNDMLVESGLEKELKVLKQFDFAKKSMSSASVIIFARKDDEGEVVDSEETVFTSEYVEITKRLFPKSKVIFSTGSTEVKVADPRFGFRYGVGVTETGESLRYNGLKIVKTILVSPVVLVVREEIEELNVFGEMLAGALKAEKYQLVKFNIYSGRVEEILKILPSFRSPTVNHLADGAVAIETVIAKEELIDATIAIKKNGGKDILIQDINVTV
jgi:ATP phosphoribosyltransferase